MFAGLPRDNVKADIRHLSFHFWSRVSCRHFVLFEWSFDLSDRPNEQTDFNSKNASSGNCRQRTGLQK